SLAGGIKAGSTYQLDKWKDRRTVVGLIQNPDLVQGLDVSVLGTAAEYRINRALEDIATNARTAAGASDSADFGTAVHAWTEAVDMGLVPFEAVPEMFRRHVAVYRAALADANIEIVTDMVERIIYNPTTGTVGTADRIYRLDDGSLIIGDLKTSETL